MQKRDGERHAHPFPLTIVLLAVLILEDLEALAVLLRHLAPLGDAVLHRGDDSVVLAT